MKRRVVVAGLGLWVVVVALGSGLTWLVVQHVAHVVSSDPRTADAVAGRAVPPASPGVGPTSAPTAAPSAARPPRRPTPVARPTSSATGGPARAAGTPRSAAPRVPAPTTAVPVAPVTPPRAAPTRAPAPRGGAGGQAPPGSLGPGSQPGSGGSASTRTATWSGTGGRLTVSCRRASASLVSASPADGWQVEVGSRGGEEVEVTFRHPGEEVQVQGRCGAGSPRFAVERGDDD